MHILRLYTLANGATQTFPRVVIREVQVGPHSIKNVPATINPAASEPLLRAALDRPARGEVFSNGIGHRAMTMPATAGMAL